MLTTFENFVEDSLTLTSNTPDVRSLENYEEHYLFTYGTLMTGHLRHSMLTYNVDTIFIGAGQTASDCYELKNKIGIDNSYPVLFNCSDRDRRGYVKGEVYLVPTEVIYKLDKMEQNGVLYHRTYIPIVFRYMDKKDHDKIKFYRRYMFTYVADSKRWEGVPNLKKIYPNYYHKPNCAEKFPRYEFTTFHEKTKL